MLKQFNKESGWKMQYILAYMLLNAANDVPGYKWNLLDETMRLDAYMDLLRMTRYYA